MSTRITPSGKERFFSEDKIIVSKTNLKGHITYANELFMNLAGYPEKHLLGAPHSLIRHPDMPRCVFKLLWDTIEAKQEIFAYVVNLSSNGDHYWVFAHVTPSFDKNGNIVSYHSNRRAPKRDAIDNVIIPLYKTLLDEERKHKNRKDGLQSSYDMLKNILKEKDVSYDEFIFSI